GEEKDVPRPVEIRQRVLLVPDEDVPPARSDAFREALQLGHPFPVPDVNGRQARHPRRRADRLLVTPPRGHLPDGPRRERARVNTKLPPGLIPPRSRPKPLRVHDRRKNGPGLAELLADRAVRERERLRAA